MIIDTYCIHSSVCRVCLFFCVHTVQGGWAQVYLLLSVPFTLCLDSKMPLFLPGSKKKTKSSFGGKRVLCATSPLMDKPHTPSPLLMQLGIGPISPTTWQSLQTFQHDPKSFCFVGIHCMLKNGKCATAAIAPQPRISLLCHRKYSWIFRNIPPLKIAQRHKWHTFPFKFSPDIAGPPRPLCQQTQHPLWYCCIMPWLDIGYCVGLWPKLFS